MQSLVNGTITPDDESVATKVSEYVDVIKMESSIPTALKKAIEAYISLEGLPAALVNLLLRIEHYSTNALNEDFPEFLITNCHRFFLLKCIKALPGWQSFGCLIICQVCIRL